jgi:hypothetical protein
MGAWPKPPNDAPEGHRWEAVSAGPDWKVLPGFRCRAGASQYTRACGRPSAAALLRGVLRKSWWAYCPEHMYGCWVEGDQVKQWRLIEAGGSS